MKTQPPEGKPTAICYRCKVEKSTDLFHKEKKKKTGHHHVCKQCCAMRDAIRYRENPERRKPRVRTSEVKRKAIEKTRRMNEKYPEKNQARIKFRNAVAAGKIKKMPCEICGSLEVQGHHTDYSKPLDVMWLCRKHHMEQHRKYKVIPEKIAKFFTKEEKTCPDCGNKFMSSSVLKIYCSRYCMKRNFRHRTSPNAHLYGFNTAIDTLLEEENI